jgi:dihydroorotate dehydrogenase (NAD+) catalytic subunit
LVELRRFVELLTSHLPHFQAPVGLQLNVSCPNVGLKKSALLTDIPQVVQVASALGIPLLVKVSVLSLSPEESVALSAEPHLDGLVVSNTVPWAQLREARLEAPRLFGTQRSPLAELGGGGVSGAALHPLVCDWIRRARAAGLRLPLVAEGGTLSNRDIDEKLAAGADAVGLGSVAFLRPWRVRGMVRHALSRPAPRLLTDGDEGRRGDRQG